MLFQKIVCKKIFYKKKRNSALEKLLESLNKEKEKRMNAETLNTSNWDNIARPEQKLPTGNWFIWLIMAGRGFGKTRTGSESIKQLALSGKYKRICLLSETYEQARAVMIEGESGLLNIHNHDEIEYSSSKKEIKWGNGAIASCYSAENLEALRGPQFDLAWIDEFAKFKNAKEVFDQLMFCMRLGNPKIIITTTPRNIPILKQLMQRKDIVLSHGSTMDNAENLSSIYLENIKEQYLNTNIGRQEVEGLIVEDDEFKLWNEENFIYEPCPDHFDKVVVAVDPATTSHSKSNKTGIVVVGKKADKYYVIEDKTQILKPEIWCNIAYDLYKKHNAVKILVETNQGGEILMTMLENFKNAPWQEVKAKDSKYERYIPIASLYQQKKVIHTKKFENLELQMINAHINYEDDAIDALTWAIFELMKAKQANFSIW